MKNRTLIFLSSVFMSFGLFGENRPYIIGSILGGLGNQLFEVATTCALAWDHGAEPYFPDYIPLLPHSQSLHHVLFRCALYPPTNEITYEWSTPVYGYQPIPFVNGMKLSGYSQNEKYFAHYRDRLIAFFLPKESDLQYIKNKYGKLLDHPESVCVHIRYYFAEKPDEPAFRQYDEEYYEKAMNLFSNEALFLVVSDNMEFAKKIISTKGRHVFFIEQEPHYIDFYLQTLCKHNIIGNSTFSWWGAWLNQNQRQIVVRPAKWIDGYPDIGGPSSWIRLQARSFQEKCCTKVDF
ncbi:MAG: hypothetical protein ACD_17C00542G0001 [uncultured bacterium]|nr:MAG: hypothetical protein ACD_17C00542G0001 [uncultured bacterium]OGN56351.1 MAG: hypothetical protein A2796_02895 [Chlamydiae bacterium RIFCSPHIGHO2_01_FULL_44_39]OGN57888.1 MAG: hypothetical protein A3C42_02930 [Chlamydiae bacterium RIFCSPHIGHO2_02_FULL_45_9]OGN60257.1 MAG: hypothetical protein A3D96_05445 [Chlamydiae bacterium RIFCSPHIGHO2_12_FULL_44_59]OGN67090.1 MAG: hypothetical protein A2978_00600 [Chlamydiae bacterium RIFCSPLOWO2_01_FULL_44_52]OGN67680.1 MAG: hypothetical protein A3